MVRRAPRVPLAVLVALLGFLALSTSAVAGTTCGKRVVDDWWDNGRVDKQYPLHCYEEAIDSLPVDVKDYSSAEDDIRRALQYALQGKPDPGGADPTPGDDDPGSIAGPGGPSIGRPGDPDGGPIGNGLDAVGPSDASSIPIPLLVLAGLALVLLAAGSIGYVARRVQARRVHESGG